MNEKSIIEKIKQTVGIFDLASRLGYVIKNNKTSCFNACAHNNNDNNPSLHLYKDTNSFHCFACVISGSVIDFCMGVKAIDFQTAVKELCEMYNIRIDSTKPKVVEIYEYKNEDGNVLYVKERVEPGRDGKNKEFFFKHMKDGKWVNGRGCEPVLYNLPNVIKAEFVVFTEGEGKVELLRSLGITATTLDSGSNSKWHDSYTKYIEGKKEVPLFPDNDKPGEAYVLEIANGIQDKVEVVKIVELPGLNNKEDIADWMKIPGNNKEKLIEIIKNCPIFNMELSKRDNLIKQINEAVENIQIHPAQDFKNDVMYYGIKISGEPMLINSENEIITYTEANSKGLRISKETDIFRFSKNGILRYYRDNEEVKLSEIYTKISNYLGDFIFFKDNLERTYLTLWLIGTYFYKIFKYYPYVWITAEKGSGKTLLMEVADLIAFNGDMASNVTEASIYRDVDCNSITMFLDEVEKLGKKDSDTHGALMSILNTGFASSGFVKRAVGTPDNYRIYRYSSYSPKMIAGIKKISDVVQDRTVKVKMLKKKKTEKVKRFKSTKKLQSIITTIRDDLYISGLQYCKVFSDIYNYHYEEIPGLDHLENRELDIWEPIFTIGSVIDMEDESLDVVKSMERFSKKSSSERTEDNKEQNDAIKLLSVLDEIIKDDSIKYMKVEGDTRYYKTEIIFKHFQSTEYYSWLKDDQKGWLTNLLKDKLKIKNKPIRSSVDQKTVRAYGFNMEYIKDHIVRYLENINASKD